MWAVTSTAKKDAAMNNWIDRNLNAIFEWTFGTLLVLSILLAIAVVAFAAAAITGRIPMRPEAAPCRCAEIQIAQ
jgi:hypothetical protein